MPDLDDFIDRLEVELHDTSNVVWSVATLQRHFERALREYAQWDPRQQKNTLTTTGGSRDVSLSTLTDLVKVFKVEYPTGEWPEHFEQFRVWGTTLTLLGERVPAGVENVVVYWGSLHSVTSGAPGTSTLRTEAEDLVVLGASAYAMLELAADTVNQVNVGGARSPVEYRAEGQRRLEDFRKQGMDFGLKSELQLAQLYAPATGAQSQQIVGFDP